MPLRGSFSKASSLWYSGVQAKSSSCVHAYRLYSSIASQVMQSHSAILYLGTVNWCYDEFNPYGSNFCRN